MENINDIRLLYQKYVTDSISDSEKAQLLNYFKSCSDDDLKEITGIFLREQTIVPDDLSHLNERTAAILKQIKTEVSSTETDVKTFLWKPLLYAAAALLLVSFSIFYYLQVDKISVESPQVSKVNGDIAPGKIGATLTLANGKRIDLSDVNNGKVASEAGISISKTADGKIVYEIKSSSQSETKQFYNTLSTTNGQTYQVRLPDGSLVDLNAASSLTYNTSLKEQGKRVVKLTGEAYFQVAKNKALPFIVKTAHQEIEVLGTHFNVNSYADQLQTRTTLLEGSVKILVGSQSKILKPGQESLISANQGISVKEVEVSDAIAWKEGYFMFNSEPMESAMNKIARWYNVMVQYDDPSLKSETLFGSISKYENISKVIRMLESTGVFNFKVSGTTIVVSKRQE